MPTTDNGLLTYDWLSDYSEEYLPDGSGCTAVLQTDWTANYIAFFPIAMLGRQLFNGGAISRELPQKHPHPSKEKWYCTNLKLVKGIGAWQVDATTGLIEFVAGPGMSAAGRAVWEATFRTLPYEVDTDERIKVGSPTAPEMRRFLERKKKWSMENLPTRGQTWKWSSDNKDVQSAAGRIVNFPTVELKYKWWWVPWQLNDATWVSLVGKINSAIFDPSGGDVLGLVGDVGTVLFLNYDTGEPVVDAGGRRCSHVEFTFLYRPTGWNFLFRPSANTFIELVDTATSTRGPYLTGDLNTIFT